MDNDDEIEKMLDDLHKEYTDLRRSRAKALSSVAMAAMKLYKEACKYANSHKDEFAKFFNEEYDGKWNNDELDKGLPRLWVQFYCERFMQV